MLGCWCFAQHWFQQPTGLGTLAPWQGRGRSLDHYTGYQGLYAFSLGSQPGMQCICTTVAICQHILNTNEPTCRGW